MAIIGCITRHNYPTAQEIRITKFASTLSSSGNEFLVLCPGTFEQKAHDEFRYGRILRLIPPRWLGKIGQVFLAPLPINFFWLLWLRSIFKKEALDLIVVRDLRLAVPAILAARLCRIRAILDLGEHYPGMMKIIGKQKSYHHITRNLFLIRNLERLSVSLADQVWVVVDENKRRLLDYAKDILVVSNFPISHQNRTFPQCNHRAWSSAGEPVTLVSLGVIDNIRGLDLVIKAFDIVASRIGNVKLVIYGDGFFKSTLQDMVRVLNLEEKVVFFGWVSENEKYDLLAKGDIGLVLHKVCDLTQHTIPNKLFDYMSVGLPVVATKINPVSNILDLERCGVCVEEDESLVADELISLIFDVKRRRYMGNNGYRAIELRYTWEAESKKIVTAIESHIKAI